ncbi:MAG: glycosyltransferase, partial [Candidatus Heimdallarchaeota archaeon]|nr:glycosyltransferase [Candidatus Heimdallarchaeota archaeon]
MKIANVAPHLTIPGDRGGAIHQFSLSKALAQQGAEVHLICQVNRGVLPDGQGIFDGIHFHDVTRFSPSHLAIPFYTAGGFKQTVRVCRKEDIDVVHDRAYLLGGGGTFAGKICNKVVGIQLDEFWLASYQRIYGPFSPFIRSKIFT